MKTHYLLIAALASPLGLVACGGGNQAEPNTAATAQAELTPMDELKGISKDLDAAVASLMKPIDDAQFIFDELGGLPKKYGITPGDMMAMAKGTLDNGKVEVKADLNVTADAKAELELLLKKLADIVVGIKATPDKVAELAKQLAADTAKVPVLASKVTASTTAISLNPFAGSEARAKAKADAAALAQVQKDVSKTISDTEAKIAGIPTMATKALAKLTASFSGGFGGA
jgi:hypothetical protein